MRTTGYKASTARGSTVAAPGAQPMQEELPVLVTEAEGKAEYTQGDCWRGTPACFHLQGGSKACP